jgi:hypothetical protein
MGGAIKASDSVMRIERSLLPSLHRRLRQGQATAAVADRTADKVPVPLQHWAGERQALLSRVRTDDQFQESRLA